MVWINCSKVSIILFLNCLLLIQQLNHVTRAISMTPEQYRHRIMTRCYNLTEYHQPLILGQTKPIGLTIDYFVALVRKIEHHSPDLGMKEMATLLLKRFHFDGVKNLISDQFYQQFIPQMQRPLEVARRVTNEKLFGEKLESGNNLTFPEEILDENEKCALFFMISHTINVTQIDNFGRKYLKEFGIVSLLNDDSFAISLNYILLGIAAALYDVEPLAFRIGHGADSYEIDPLVAITLADKLALATLESIDNYQNQLLGLQGVWNSTYCQTEYHLSEINADLMITMAEIGGGVDGWIIGHRLKSLTGHHLRRLKLSTLIDRYFSKNGLATDFGFCSSVFTPTDWIEQIRQTSLAYAFYINANFAFDNYEYVKIKGYNQDLSIQYNQYLDKALEIKYRECSRFNNLHSVDGQLETKIDLYIMIDNNGYQYSRFNLEAITKLLVKMKALNCLGRVTLMVNANRGFDTEIISSYSRDLQIRLHLLAYNTESVQFATCRLAWYNFREATINNKKILLNYLVEFFDRDQQHKTDHGLVQSHSKNFLWFSLKRNPSTEILTERDRAFYYQYRWYLLYFLNMRMFFISSYEQKLDDDLSQMVLNQGDWFKVNPANFYDEILIDRLTQRMMQTPVPLGVNDCQNLTGPFTAEYLITPNRKQYWAVYPKYFLTSDWIRFEFTGSGSKLRVCLGRYLFPENNRTQCQESETSIVFSISEPCRWSNIELCPPIYFTIFNREHPAQTSNTGNHHYCIDPECDSFDQTKWRISVSGITCTDASSSTFSSSIATSLSLIFNVYLLILLPMLAIIINVDT